MFKCVYKGHDCASVKVTVKEGIDAIDWDEVKTYQDSRHIRASEAAHRLLKFKLSNRTHFINRLPVHLLGDHLIYYETGQEKEAFASYNGSKLTA